GDDLPVRLDGDGERGVVTGAEVGGDLAVAVEARIERAVDVVPGQGERDGAHASVGVAGQHDFACRLDGVRVGGVVVRAKVGRHPTAGAETGVKGAVREVADQGEVPPGRPPRGSRDHNAAVGLQGHAGGEVVPERTNVGGDRAAGAERRVEGPGGGKPAVF